MNILLTTFGSHGDLFPFLAIGRALSDRGHTCRVATHPYFTRDIEAAGLEPAPVIARVPMAELLRHPDLFHRVRGPLLGGRYLAAVMREMALDLRREVADHRPDVMIGHYGSSSARWVAEEAAIPCASAALAPVAWNSADDPVPAYQLAPGRSRAAIASVVSRIVDPALGVALRSWVRRLRRQCGFADPHASTASGRARPPSWPSLFEEFRAGDLSLGLWAEAFRPRLAADPEGSIVCGFPWYSHPVVPGDSRLECFLGAGDPPIVFTLGSAAVNNPGDFFALAAAACARLRVRGVLVTGRDNAPPAMLPRGVIAVEWAAHARLFPRALVNVHHSGIGSTAEALRAGRPSVAIPHAFDQFNNAVRMERLGAGLMLARHHVTLDRMVAVLDRAASDGEIARRALELAPQVAENGAEHAARAIERLRPRAEEASAAA
ncbi:MAG: glycosyltransferase [Candidatus Eisenbacteria bacterium]